MTTLGSRRNSRLAETGLLLDVESGVSIPARDPFEFVPTVTLPRTGGFDPLTSEAPRLAVRRTGHSAPERFRQEFWISPATVGFDFHAALIPPSVLPGSST